MLLIKWQKTDEKTGKTGLCNWLLSRCNWRGYQGSYRRDWTCDVDRFSRVLFSSSGDVVKKSWYFLVGINRLFVAVEESRATIDKFRYWEWRIKCCSLCSNSLTSDSNPVILDASCLSALRLELAMILAFGIDPFNGVDSEQAEGGRARADVDININD